MRCLKKLKTNRKRTKPTYASVRIFYARQLPGYLRIHIYRNSRTISLRRNIKRVISRSILLRMIQWVDEWWESEIAKPRGRRHTAFEWRAKAMVYMNKRPKSEDGIYVAKMTGPMLAYYTFAYDLFVVMDNGRLDARLLERLKIRSFPGSASMNYSPRRRVFVAWIRYRTS